jgi:hypothetical protein
MLKLSTDDIIKEINWNKPPPGICRFNLFSRKSNK